MAPSPRSASSPLAAYLSEIDQTPLLNADEERTLAGGVQAGDSEARDRMISANLRLVVHIARAFTGHGVNLEDLIEEGNLGLIRAVEGFDPAMRTRFSTYAAFWIKQSIRRLVQGAQVLPLPSYVVQLVREWRRESMRLQAELGRPPHEEEINMALGLPKRKIRIIKKALNVLASRRTGGSDVGPVLDETVPSPSNGHVNRLADRELLGKAVQFLGKLDHREAEVLRLRFGLKGAEPMTLAQVGKRLRLTRERVRQIEHDALQKLHELMTPDLLRRE